MAEPFVIDPAEVHAVLVADRGDVGSWYPIRLGSLQVVDDRFEAVHMLGVRLVGPLADLEGVETRPTPRSGT